MKLTILQENLARGLAIVGRATATHSSLPILANILLKTDNGRLRLAATNLELTATCLVGAKVEEEGAITIPARTLSDLVSTLPNDKVYIQLDGKNAIRVVCGKSATTIKGIPADDFPPLPAFPEKDVVRFDAAPLKDAISKVAFAASTDQARPVLTGVNFRLDKAALTMQAADGFRASVLTQTLATPVEQPRKALIPSRALGELARLLTEAPVEMALAPDRNQVFFRTGDVELISQLLEGSYPELDSIIPKNGKTKTMVATADLLKACKQAEIFARDGGKLLAHFAIFPENGVPGFVKVSGESTETGSLQSEVTATVEGPAVEIAFNVRLVREALEAIKSPQVTLETNASNTPGLLYPVGDATFRHIIMPMSVA